MATVTTPQGTFEFNAYDMGTATWHDKSGVYMFVKQGLSGNEVLYVGLCDSFKNRFCTHERWDEAVRLGANSVHAAVVPDTATREALEKHLIGQFQPTMNTHHLGGLAGLLRRT